MKPTDSGSIPFAYFTRTYVSLKRSLGLLISEALYRTAMRHNTAGFGKTRAKRATLDKKLARRRGRSQVVHKLPINSSCSRARQIPRDSPYFLPLAWARVQRAMRRFASFGQQTRQARRVRAVDGAETAAAGGVCYKVLPHSPRRPLQPRMKVKMKKRHSSCSCARVISRSSPYF